MMRLDKGILSPPPWIADNRSRKAVASKGGGMALDLLDNPALEPGGLFVSNLRHYKSRIRRVLLDLHDSNLFSISEWNDTTDLLRALKGKADTTIPEVLFFMRPVSPFHLRKTCLEKCKTTDTPFPSCSNATATLRIWPPTKRADLRFNSIISSSLLA